MPLTDTAIRTAKPGPKTAWLADGCGCHDSRDTTAFDVGPNGMPLETFNAYRSPARPANATLFEVEG